ncbi:M14 family metallopeptidase [Sulfurimonas sp.]|uniref:M14 family metallopeptidase n=1 Tax=Sulfurimonas sp. TaxID=2022749 RepID=UPI003D0A8583
MNKIEILKLDSLSREPMVVEGFLFKGTNPDAPKVAIVGAMQGDALLPLHCSALLVNFLQNTIKERKVLGDILVIPSINHYALNISEKFWPLDKTNLNMMFPGYNEGETTQRIAAKVFETIKDYDYAISLEISSDQSTCIPHIELLKTGWEDLEGAKQFGLKIIHHKEVESIDTVTLQYNLQLWETKAYSLICPTSQHIEQAISNQIVEAIIRFLERSKVLQYKIFNEYATNILKKRDIKIIKAPESGIFISLKSPGEYVHKGDILGEIANGLTGEVIHHFKARFSGMVITVFNNALVLENSIVYRIAK